MKILIIEDEMKMASGLWTILTREGHEVDVEYDGVTGLNALARGKYDVVLLDIMLPRLDGMKVLDRIRQEGNSTPVIMLTAKSQTVDKISGLDSGADDYLTKPFDAGELMARIRAVVRRKAASRERDGLQSDRIKAFDLTLDRSSYSLAAGGKEIKLANKEYQLMEYLMTNRGRILTREMMVNKVWGIDDESNYNHLDVYISFLRKKLRFIGAKAAIKTTKSVGYSIEAGE